MVDVGDYTATHGTSGRPMQARVVHVWQVEVGKVRRFERFCDTLLVHRATSSQ